MTKCFHHLFVVDNIRYLSDPLPQQRYEYAWRIEYLKNNVFQFAVFLHLFHRLTAYKSTVLCIKYEIPQSLVFSVILQISDSKTALPLIVQPTPVILMTIST